MPVKLSIVIPTRNRGKYLHYAIATCLEQKSIPHQIIILDNNSSDDTAQIVDIFLRKGYPIEYYRSEKPLPMSLNWRRGLDYTTGEYVIFIGDDDGIVADGIEVLASAMEEVRAPVYSWTRSDFTWPCLSEIVWGLPCSYIRASRGNNSYVEVGKNTLKALKFCLKFRPESYGWLPMFYNSAISVEVIRTGMQMTGDKYFVGQCPDIVSGLLHMSLTSKVVYLDRSITINGGSSASNGSLENTLQRKEFDALNESENIGWHDDIREIIQNNQLTRIENLRAAVMDSIFRVEDALGQRRTRICRSTLKSKESSSDIPMPPELINKGRIALFDRGRIFLDVLSFSIFVGRSLHQKDAGRWKRRNSFALVFRVLAGAVVGFIQGVIRMIK